MKTFNENNLITWANRHDAKVGDKGYFGNSIQLLISNIQANKSYELINISNDYSNCFNCSISDDVRAYGFFLPIDAVKENKTYRACRTVRELYELVFNYKSKVENSFCINELIGTVIHLKQKGLDTTYYKCITGIVVYDNGDIDVRIDGYTFELPELFKNFKIEINGEWQPFGVKDE